MKKKKSIRVKSKSSSSGRAMMDFPLLQRFGIPATARASFGLYNTREEVDALVMGIRKVQEVLG